MADARFYDRAGPFSLAELVDAADAEIAGAPPSILEFSDVMPLAEARADTISFIDNRRYVEAFRKCEAGAIIVAPGHVADVFPGAADPRSQRRADGRRAVGPDWREGDVDGGCHHRRGLRHR